MNTPDVLIGQQLNNILVQQPLGQGGMARVYKGIDQSLKRIVAVKVIAEDLRASGNYAQRFEREAQAVATLKHPHIVTIFQFGVQGGLYYLVMEYVDGVDLDAILRNYKDNAELMPYADVLRILQAIGSALDYAHKQGVIHRDVKPSNIMLERGGRPVLTDFGLALRMSEGTIGNTFGSPHYVAPEQARNSANAVPQSDIYSLGVIAYELLTGTLPFDDVSPTALAMQHILSPVPSPRAFNHDLSQQVDEVLLQVLAKEPEDRFETAETFVASLKQALDALRLHPIKVMTAGLPPLPAGVTPPPPRRLSMQTARDKLDQELALTQARGQALTRYPAVPARSPALHESVQAGPPRPGWRGYVLAAIVTLIAVATVALLSSGILKAPLPIPTVAVLPSNTSTLSATATVIPTQEPTSAVAVLPSEIPSSVPPTALPTAILTILVPAVVPTVAVSPTTSLTQAAATPAQPSSTSTVLYPNGQLLTLFWDDNTFYAANQSENNMLIANVTLERVLTSGGFGERYEGKRWAAYYSFTEVKKCVILKATNVYYFPRDECPYGINANVNAQKIEMFWTSRSNSVQFRVLWNNKEVARCQIVQQRCAVRFPA